MNPEENSGAHNSASEATPTPPPAGEAASTGVTSATTNHEATPDSTPGNQKLWAIVGYIVPILFFVPLLSDDTKHVPAVRFHANQQAILLVVLFVLYLLQHVLYMLFYVGGVFMPIVTLLQLGVLVLVIIGVVHAVQGKEKELPLIGHFRIV